MSNFDPTLMAGKLTHRRLEMLDGWRALSIILVLAGHMLPLGVKGWSINAPVAALGMSVFFNLSGFLVVSILLRNQSLFSFAVRRVARILPLAWAVLIVVLSVAGASKAEWSANLLFYANLPPFYLKHGGHFWSLGVEMQFYAAIGIVVALLGIRHLWLVPAVCVGVTLLRIYHGEPMSIVTWYRIDEILAGGTLALLIHFYGDLTKKWLERIPFPLVAGSFLLSTTHIGALAAFSYARPYLSVTMLAVTIVRKVPVISPLLEAKAARYLANISYALYIFHPYSMEGWLGSGGTLEKYAKRPICIALTFIAAHLSTFKYEEPINRWAHRITSSRMPRSAAV